MKFGYARVSTVEQDLSAQISALELAGCDEVLSEQASGTIAARPELNRLLDKLRGGDVVVVYRLDRLGRSLTHLVELINHFDANQIELVSLTEQIDTTTATGKLLVHLFAMLSEFERNLISERTKAGLAAARARGRKGGRPKTMDGKQVRLAKAMMQDPLVTKKDIAEQFGVSVSTIYRYLR
ncbi:MAG: recombinase family protein [Ferrimonas sp.]